MLITWNISQLDRRVGDGFVETVHWQASASDGEHAAFAYGSCSWTEGEPKIPYDELTKRQVLRWVWKTVNKVSVEASLARQIDRQKNPEQVSGLPWPTDLEELEGDFVEDEEENALFDNQSITNESKEI